MPKITDLDLPDRLETSIPGLFVRDIPIVELEAMQDEAGDDEDLGFLYFDRILCDENGEKFEDVGSKEDVKKLGQLKLAAISRAVSEALDTSGKD